ncbi:carbohydrate esterase family 3 protein [Hypoxylon sp. FL1150]|nr:carbohydrate esterase family 3 protein [Hypoxylon sp. FL1150]
MPGYNPNSSLTVPLGVSVTEITRWRATLWDRLKAKCDSVDPGFASQHREGHTGYLAIDIAYDYAEAWINDTIPDIVIWMLNTDDITARRYKAANKIIMSTVGPLPGNMMPVANLNGMIPGWVAGQDTMQSPVYVNDIYPFPNNFLREGISPNDAGDGMISSGSGTFLTWNIGSNTIEIVTIT